MHVHWHEGLFLQPHHMQIMQRQLQSDIRAARSLFNPHCYGVVSCKLDPDSLADGRIRFESLHVILPSGEEVIYPGNANLPALDIKAELARTVGPLDILLAVPLWTKSRANSFSEGERADPRIKLLHIPEEVREVADENTGENPQTVYVRKTNARLVLKAEDLSDMESIPLLRIIRATGDDSGKPRQDTQYVPPSLQLRSSPVLHDMMRELVAQLNASRNDLRIKAATGGVGLEAKWELTLKLLALNRFCASLPSLVEEGRMPPYAIYLELRELLGELLASQPAKTTFDCEPYDHLDPLRSIKEVDQKVRELLITGPSGRVIKILFAGVTGEPGLVRAVLEQKHFEGISGYYLGIQTTIADRTKLALFVSDANKFKMMPQSMERMAVFGVELKEENYPPLDLPAQNNLYYFRLVPSANQRRWDQIQRDKAISLVWNSGQFDLTDAKFTLYLTLPASQT